MNEETLILRAMSMLRGSRTYEADARKPAAGGNSKAGSALSLLTHVPRSVAETAVCAALIQLDRESEVPA
jgi:hypothetical protein